MPQLTDAKLRNTKPGASEQRASACGPARSIAFEGCPDSAPRDNVLHGAGRGESCLLAGFSDDGKPIHIVCGRMDDWLVVVTVYIPTPPEFKTPFERG
jgi:hypothetical protein